MSDPELDRQAAEALGTARQHLDKLARYAPESETEASAIEANDPAWWDQARFERLTDICGAAHLAVENAVKAYTAAVARKRYKWEHKIEVLLQDLPAPARQRFEALIDPLTPQELNEWRSAATYMEQEASRSVLAQITPSFVADFCQVVQACCEHTASEIANRSAVPEHLLRPANEMLTSVRRARDSQYVDQVRHQPPFAASTYSNKNLAVHPTAISEPRMPASVTRREATTQAQPSPESPKPIWRLLARARKSVASRSRPASTRDEVNGATTSPTRSMPEDLVLGATTTAGTTLRPKIVEALQQNRRASYASIARSVGASKGYVAQIASEEGLARRKRR